MAHRQRVLVTAGAAAGLSAAFSIRNLFDRDYEVVSPFAWAPGTGIDVLRMDGRTYWVQLNVDL